MPIKIDGQKKKKDCPIEVSTELMSRKRVPKIPDITEKADQLVYRPFFIVECKNEQKEDFHILFDAVSGDFSLLDA